MNRERTEQLQQQQHFNFNQEIHQNNQQQQNFETFSVMELKQETEPIESTEYRQQSDEIHIKKEILDDQVPYYETFTVTDLKIETEASEIRNPNEHVMCQYREMELEPKQIQHLPINHEINIKEEIQENPVQFNHHLPVPDDNSYQFTPQAVKIGFEQQNSGTLPLPSGGVLHNPSNLCENRATKRRTSKANQKLSQEELEAIRREGRRRNQFNYRQRIKLKNQQQPQQKSN